MMSRKHLVGILIATMLIVGSALGIRAIPVSAASVHGVPFGGSYSGTAAFTSATTITFSGTGVATYLGRGANEGHVIVTGQDSSCPGGIANVNDETLTAANGDTLLLTSYDVACPTSPGVLHGTGHWVVTGGTGNFSGASGQGTIEGHSDFNQGVFAFRLTGTISAPNQG